MGKITEAKVSENQKKTWSAPAVEIISERDIESLITVNFIEGGGPTPAQGTISSGS